MWVQCIKLILLLHIIHIQAYYHHQQQQRSTNKHILHHQPSPNISSNRKSSPLTLRSFNYPYIKVRHAGHSKFPHLERVENRLEFTKPASAWSSLYNKRKMKEEIYANYEDDYNDDWDDDDEDDEYNNVENEDKNDDEDDDEEYDVMDGDNYQAEEATSAPSTSSLTEYKWRHYGTRSRVEESRRNQMQHQQQLASGEITASAAIEHIRRMSLEAKCNLAKPKVLNVQHEHPSPGKRYLPHCTVLYRCSEDTGCCTTPDTKCQPKRQTLVHLYFYTSTIGKQGSRIEKITFHNHTECGCMKAGSTSVETEIAPENLLSPRSLRSGTQSANSLSCSCPEEFIADYRHNMKCICDCSTNNIDCINMKKGKEHFSLKDRKCILEEKCGIPNCEYGTYIKGRGRCPRKQEKLDTYANIPTRIPN